MKSKKINQIFSVIIFSIFLFSCQEGPSQTDPNYQGPPKGHIITVERAQEMYDSYSQRRVPIIKKYEDSISSTTPYSPTRYAEFDLETMKQYIAYLEHEAKQAKVDVKTLRIYLSNYPKDAKFPNGETVKYPRQNSLFIVPTMEHKGSNVGFSIEEMDGKYTAVPINKGKMMSNERKENEGKGGPNGELNEAGFFLPTSSTQGGTTSLILNDAHITPPPSSGPNDFGDNN